MSAARKIFLNTVLQSVGKIISVGIGLFTIGLMSRYLGSAGFGQYATIISVMGFFGVLADLGLYLVAAREIAQEQADEKKILGNVFALRFVSVTGVLLLGAIIALLFPYDPEVKKGMFVGVLAFVFVSGTQVLVGVFQKYLIFYKLTASEILQRLITLAGTIMAVKLEYGILTFIGILVLSNAAHFLVCLTIVRKIIPFKLEFDFAFWKQILKKSWPLAFSVVLNLIYFRADTLILSVFRPPAEVGIYGLSYKILEILVAFPAMFAGLIMPLLSRFAYKDWTSYKVYLQKSFDAVLLVIVPMVIVAMFFSKPIIGLIGGSSFEEAASILQILIIATAFIYLGNLIGYTVVALNIQRTMVWGYLSGSLLGLVLYFWLIPKYSYYGAAVSTVIVEMVVFAVAYILTSRAANFFPSFRMALWALLAALPTVALFYFVNFNWIAEILLGLALYGGLLIKFQIIPKEFIKLLLWQDRKTS